MNDKIDDTKETEERNKKIEHVKNEILKKHPHLADEIKKIQENKKQREIDNANQQSNLSKIRNYDHSNASLPLSFNDIIDNPAEKHENILHPILPVQGWMFIYAETGLGKTLLTLNLAYAIASGGTFLKYKAPKPKRVLYIDGEMSYSAIYFRLMSIVEQQGKLDFPDNFYLYTPDKLLPKDASPDSIPLPMPKICSTFGQDFYTAIIKKLNIDVLIIDNLSALSTHDENSAQEWYVIQDWFTELKALGKSIILVHHAGKNGDYRGSSRITDTADTTICLSCSDKSLPDDDKNNQKRFNIEYEKNRNFDGEDAKNFEVILEDKIWNHQSIEISIIDKIIVCLNSNMSQRDIAKELLISQSTVHRMVKKARLTGRVK